VRDQLRRLGGFADPPVLPPIGMEEPWYYRNHARFSALRDGSLGFTRHHSRFIIRIEHCWIVQPPINHALTLLHGHCRKLHNVSVRHGLRTGQLLVSPMIKGVEPALATGQPYLEEEVLGRRFRVAAASFFQVNTVQADTLARLALERLELRPDSVVVDAYCGVGTFGILIAERARRVIGIEDSAAALVDAAHNARHLDNIDFLRGAVEAVLPGLAERVDGVVIDPPRAGCRPEVLEALIALRPRRLVYVSCEPSTLARDLRILVDGGFELLEVQPVDMFPQTYHVENVATLEWR
jgi:23S rRNA (uracil1939-C5)-methyltransferase